VLLRRATVSDIPALAALGAATFTEAFGNLYAPKDLSAFLAAARSEDAYSRLMRDARNAIWLALASDATAPVGYAVAGPCKLPVEGLTPSAGEILELYVLADHRQHRLGSRLLAGALDWLATEKRQPVYVGVWSQNLGAQRLYERSGFRKVAEYDFPVGDHLDREYILKRA
jgi:diamine N-acetyltransferase